jgi:putative esterase
MSTTLRKFSRRAGVLLAGMIACALLAGPLSVIFPQAADAATVSDSFDRASGGLGSNWTTVAGTAAPQISGNTLHAGTASALNSAYWSASTFGSDQFAQGTLPGSSGGNYGPGLAVRLSSSKGYVLWYGNSTSTVSLWRMDSASSWTQLKASGTLKITAATDVWKIQVVGSTITGYQNGTQVVQATDTKITAGSPGVWLYYAANQIDNWSGGDASAAPSTYTVGGTASGLASGNTVILQNNGGNDLSVAANGAFTFGAALAAGAAYNITVKTNPAGQTCTVANGTGAVGAANVTTVAVTCATSGGGGGGGGGGTGTATDDFNRANGALGGNWTAMSDGALTIAGQVAKGGNGAYSGDIRTAETYPADQSSQVEVTATQLSGGQWIGPAVRASGGGSNLYLGIYFWNGGSPELMLFKRTSGSFTQLGSSYPVSALPAGTQLKLSAAGSTLTLSQNGTARITATDTSLTSGAPGIMAYGTGTADNWAGSGVATSGPYTVGGTVSGLASGATVVLQNNFGNDLSVTASGAFTFGTALATGAAYNVTVRTSPPGQTCTVASGTGTVGSANVTNVAVTCTTTGGGGGGTGGLQVTYTGADASGVQSYDMLSSEDGGSTQVLRVLPPSSPAAGVKHNFLFVLPVEPNQGTSFGDGVGTMAAANAQNQYNLTVIEPSFPTDPWYADHPTDTSMKYESFLTTQLVPWVKANLSITGTEQSWLIGFSKSGIGGQDLLLKHPDQFSVGASWDFPAAMTSYAGADPYGTVGGNSAVNYGTNANFQANYQLSSSFLSAHKAPFTTANRIWIGGYSAFQQDLASYNTLLTQAGIKHTTETPTPASHAWDSGWVPQALAALEQDSVALGG